MSTTEQEPRAADTDALIGGRFQVESLLGQGGMGAVYRVRDKRTGRQLALKQLRTDRASSLSPLAITHFEREYHTLRQLAHPSIIEVHDYGVEGATAFYTMELLDGQDVRERGRLPWREVCAVLCDVASSLAVIHARRLLHRDISIRNIRCTTGGRAKLIDFGAMTPMGVVKSVVGTAPFVAPEALQMQMLDGRADLYALGAVAYWMLTGRQAYPARNFEQLPDLWRTAPAAPRAYNGEVPEALEKLVLELIELERNARPASAAEVMERLSGIAGLPARELPEVTRSYLVMPMLVGRDEPIRDVRVKLVSAIQHGRGSSVLIEGEQGTGRSRLLDACVLEAKLLGAVVLRADSGHSAAGDFGLATALCQQLVEALPGPARRAAEPFGTELAQLLPGLSRSATTAGLEATSLRPQERTSLPVSDPPADVALSLPPARASGPQPAPETLEPQRIAAAVRDWFLAITRRRPVVIAVDDVDAIDPSSAVLLATLAQGAARRKLVLLFTSRSGAPATGALSVLRELAEGIELEPLGPEQFETLLRSLFGEGSRLPALSHRLYQLSGGNPRWTLELCERLVEQGVVRYEAGSWSLPADLSGQQLPDSLLGMLRARLAGLSPDARALGEALALTDPMLVPLERYALLTDHGDAGRTYGALDVLVRCSVMVPAGDRHRFTQTGFQDLLHAEVPDERRRALHARIAESLGECADPVRVPYHMMCAGKELEALEKTRVLRFIPRSYGSKLMPELLAAGAQAATRRRLPLPAQLDVRQGVVAFSASAADPDGFERHAGALLERFMRDSGLADYLELGDDVPEPARLSKALERVAARNQATPEAERGLPPDQAAAMLGLLVANFMMMASVARDLDILERVPSLAPLFPAAPALRVWQRLIDIERMTLGGRSTRAEQLSRELIEQLQAPEALGVVPFYAQLMRRKQMIVQALAAASRGSAATLTWSAELEQVIGYRASAWRARMLYELMIGNPEAANVCRRRAELLNVQDSGPAILPGVTVVAESTAYLHTQDVVGLKRVVERIEAMAARFTQWRPAHAIARSHYLRLRGEYAAALEALQPALELRAGRHSDYGHAAAAHVSLLHLLGDATGAFEQGRSYIERCVAAELPDARCELLRVVGDASTSAGRLADAERMLDEHLASLLAQGTQGLMLGLGYEARCRLAIAARDEAAVRHYAELSAEQYKGARNPLLSAHYRDLVREAELAGIDLPTALQHAADVTSGPHTAGATAGLGELETIGSRLLHCTDATERAREGLHSLLQLMGASGGFLFAIEDDHLRLLAAIDEPQAPPRELVETLERVLRKDLETDEEQTNYMTAVASSPPTQTSAVMHSHESVILVSRRAEREVTAGIAALRYASTQRNLVRRAVLDALVETLDTHGVFTAAVSR